MNKIRCYLYTNDPLLTMLRTEEEFRDLFGDPDEFDSYVELDTEFVSEFMAVRARFFRMCNDLEKLRG